MYIPFFLMLKKKKKKKTKENLGVCPEKYCYQQHKNVPIKLRINMMEGPLTIYKLERFSCP
jgi:hypothetical protein